MFISKKNNQKQENQGKLQSTALPEKLLNSGYSRFDNNPLFMLLFLSTSNECQHCFSNLGGSKI